MKIKKENLKLNKKSVVIGTIIIGIICIGVAYGLTKTGDSAKDNVSVKKTVEKADKKQDKKANDSKSNKDKVDKKDTKNDVKADDDKVSDDNKKTPTSENKASKSNASSSSGSASTSSGSSSAAPSTSGTTSSGSAPAPKIKRWVVDHKAWDEPVTQPVYVNTWWIKFTDGSTKIYYDKGEWNNTLDNATGNIASWGNGEQVADPSGATEIVGYIHHDEVGHWE